MPGSRLPHRGRGRSRLQRRDTWPEELQRRSDLEPAAARGRGAGAARRPAWTSRHATSRPPPAASGWPRSTCPTATRSARTSSPTSSPGWSACARTPPHCWSSTSRWSWAAISTSFRSPWTAMTPRRGWATRCSSRRAGGPFARCSTWASPRPIARCIPTQRGAYTFWDYQGGAFQLDHGIRIDHLLLSPQAADRLVDCTIDKNPRRQPRASDHTPVIVELRD